MTTNVFAAKSPVTSLMPDNCRTRASVTATQPPQDQPPISNPVLAVITVGDVAAGASWGIRFKRAGVGVLAAEDLHAVVTVKVRPNMMVGTFTANRPLVIGYPLLIMVR